MQKLLPTGGVQGTEQSSAAVSGWNNEERKSISSESAFLGVRPQCPRCRAKLDWLDCPFCGLQMQVDRGILCGLPPDRDAHYARFIEDRERSSNAQGRGIHNADFYLGLPYKDLSGINTEGWKIQARAFDYLVKHVLNPDVQLNGGRILDLGAGVCWMSFRLALARYRPFAVDLLTNDRDGLGAAEHFRKHLPAMFPRFQAELARLPFQDEQFDAVVFNASLHRAEDYVATLREALRCVKSGGLVIVSGTPWYAHEDSGRKTVLERRTSFLQRYGSLSGFIGSLEYLTDERLRALEEQLSVRWSIHYPGYGIRWVLRPLVAKIRSKGEPSRYRIYTTRKP